MIKKIRIISCVLTVMLALVIALSACASNDDKGEIKPSDKVIRKAAWSTPYNGNIGDAPWGAQPSDNTVENWQVMAEAGFNYAIPTHDVTWEDVNQTLTNAEQVGIKVLVTDHSSPSLYNIIRRNEGSTYEQTMAAILAVEDQLKEKYNSLTEYESFGGIVVIDEPSMAYYDAIAAGQDWWTQNYPEYEYYVNLLPSYASPAQLFGSNYDDSLKFSDYVDRFINKTNPAFISYDHYALRRAGLMGTIRPAWLSDLEVFAEASKRYDIPFFIFLLCTGHWDYIRPQTYREFAWQAYSALAYGAQGLQAFTYWSYLIPDNNPDNLAEGLVGPRGEIMPLYYAVQEVFNEISAFENYYMNFKWQGTMPIGVSGHGTYALLTNPLKSLTGVSKVTAEKEALIGEFKDKNNNIAYMVTNYSSPFKSETNKVTLKFTNAKKALVFKKGRKVVYQLTNNTLEFEMSTGEGYFVIPIK